MSDPDNSLDTRIRVSQYLLLNSEEAIKKWLSLISEAYDQGRDKLSQDGEPSGVSG